MNWNILVYCRYLGLSLFNYLVASLAIVHVWVILEVKFAWVF